MARQFRITNAQHKAQILLSFSNRIKTLNGREAAMEIRSNKWTTSRYFKTSSNAEIDSRVFRAIEINIVDATWDIEIDITNYFNRNICFRQVLVSLVTTFFIHMEIKAIHSQMKLLSSCEGKFSCLRFPLHDERIFNEFLRWNELSSEMIIGFSES